MITNVYNFIYCAICLLWLFLLYYRFPLPPKKKTPAKKADKRLKMDHDLFRSVLHFERYKDSFIKGTIIHERFVDLVDLKDTFIPTCFEGRGWEKL